VSRERVGWIRSFASGTAVLFLISWIFPLAAGLAKDTRSFPAWWGPVDVGIAFLLAISAFAIQALARGNADREAEQATYRIYRIVTHAIMALAVLVIFGGDRISWAHCATGFAWRAWLGLYILPWWFTARRSAGGAGVK
jgi:hypothetical protein